MKKSLNRSLISILGMGWLSFLIAGSIIIKVFAAPEIVLFIDRSFCPPEQWKNVVENYRDFYQKNQDKKLKITSVVLFSDLGDETLKMIPTPEEISRVSTYGKLNNNRQNEIKKISGSGKILTCNN